VIQEPASPHNLAYLEGLYADFVRDAQSVPPDYREYFARMGASNGNGSAFRLRPSFPRRGLFQSAGGNGQAAAAMAPDQPLLQEKVAQLVRNFRVRGHRMARLDPLDRPRPEVPDLNPFALGFTEADMDREFSTVYLGGPHNVLTLRQILQRLRNTYCRSIGVQFMHIDNLAVRTWLQDRMETTENRIELARQEQIRILRKLTDAVVFEQFLQKKYIGAKTFSLEGAETLIPLLDLAIEKAGEQDVDEIVIGMAHRGRLNVLANILGKSPQAIFHEFEDTEPHKYMGGGDVKYHLGFSSDWKTQTGHNVHLSLCFNPSHLEFINPVAMGRMRAKQDRVGDAARRRGLTLLIHGDAAIAGEGVVQETLNLSQLPGYSVGGALHVVINNQLGFTTLPPQYRSSTYCTDIARMLQSPIFHVNGEDPEAVAQCVRLAMDFRQQFQRDVFIDMYCFRRRGHNEGDEPSFTQPLMYQTIEQRRTVREAYVERLLKLGGLKRSEADAMERQSTESLESALTEIRAGKGYHHQKPLQGIWTDYHGGLDSAVSEADTGVRKEQLVKLLRAMTKLPPDFHPHPKVLRLIETRREMAAGAKPLDWSAAEALALASLAAEGHRIRLSGQDTERGTFSQRHAVLHDVEDGHTYGILQHVSEGQAPVEIINSSLSEAGVLGFEYGYSLDMPEGLVGWEAQFGDFMNAAQVIIDQFIASAEDKWHRLSGIVLLLPHGFEGQGPEHSSARLERFLTLAAEDNIQVTYPSTPAQYFHLLRRQVLRPLRKPLVVMTPKSLLRNPECVSSLEDLAGGRFQRVVRDSGGAGQAPSRILLCTGKIYYELARRRAEQKRSDVAIVRVEQLYPFPEEPLKEALAGCPDTTPVYWVQEEPKNMGAWPFLRSRFTHTIAGRLPLHGICRLESASPATGSPAAHRIEQEQIISEAFGINVKPSL
jgi:2-oxoglutarate dehydrogenase E1 component